MRVRVTANQPHGLIGVQLRTGDIVFCDKPLVLDVESEDSIIEPVLRSLVKIERLDDTNTEAETGGDATEGAPDAGAQPTVEEASESGRKRRARAEETVTPGE